MCESCRCDRMYKGEKKERKDYVYEIMCVCVRTSTRAMGNDSVIINIKEIILPN